MVGTWCLKARADESSPNLDGNHVGRVEGSLVIKFSLERSEWFWDADWLHPPPWALQWHTGDLRSPYLVVPLLT